MARVYYLDADGTIASTEGKPPAGRTTYTTYAAAQAALEDRRVWYVNANGTVTSTVGLPPAGAKTYVSKAAAIAASPTGGVLKPSTTPGAPPTSEQTVYWIANGAVVSGPLSKAPGGQVFTSAGDAQTALSTGTAGVTGDNVASRQSAVARVIQALADMGLDTPEASAWVQERMVALGPEGYNQVMLELPKQQFFIDRFPAIGKLAGSGHAISPADYLDYEVTADRLERLYGLPKGSLTSKDKITGLLEAQVSPSELTWRVGTAYANAMKAPAAVRNALQSMYGIGPGALAQYYLDPDNSQTLLEQQFATAQVKGASTIAGVAMSDAMAASLAEKGVSFGTSLTRAAQAAADQSLTRGERGLVSGQTLLEGEFGDYGYGESASALEYARKSRLAAFEGQGGAYMGQSGVSGAGSASE